MELVVGNQPTAFLTIVELIKDFEARNLYKTFIDHRQKFAEHDFHLYLEDGHVMISTTKVERAYLE